MVTKQTEVGEMEKDDRDAQSLRTRHETRERKTQESSNLKKGTSPQTNTLRAQNSYQPKRGRVQGATRLAGATAALGAAYAAGNPEAVQQIRQSIGATINATLDRVKRLYDDAGEDFSSSDLQDILKGPPSIPSFPFIMFSLAVLKDLLDFLDFTLILTILVFFFSIIISIIFTLWSWNKMGGWWWRRYIIKWIWTRLIVALFIEFIPFVQIIPATTILVLLTHYREVRVVKLCNEAFDILHESGVTKFLR